MRTAIRIPVPGLLALTAGATGLSAQAWQDAQVARAGAAILSAGS